jgi:hypothetical protein
MDSALGRMDRYIHYISAISEGPLRVTAELVLVLFFSKFLPIRQCNVFSNMEGTLSYHDGTQVGGFSSIELSKTTTDLLISLLPW